MERITQVTKDCFVALAQLRQADPLLLPPPERVHAQLRGFVEQLLQRAGELGLSPQDAQDCAYALVALIDETALGLGEPLAGFWMGNLLQYHFFQENLAGDGFFTRLQAVRGDARRTEVLRVYWLCLAFGFQGRYRIRGGELELMALVDSVQHELVRRGALAAPEGLSPQGARPQEALTRTQRSAPVLLVSAAAVLLAVLVFGGLRWSLQHKVSAVAADIAAWNGK
jgi:type VI secretion system protein ImpK